MKVYLINIAASFIVLFNTLTGGSYRNTFSARVGLASTNGARWAKIAEKIINSMLFYGDHCYWEAKNEGFI